MFKIVKQIENPATYELRSVIRFLNVRNATPGGIYPPAIPPSLAVWFLDSAKKQKASGDTYVAKNELVAFMSLKKAVRHLSDEVQKSKDVDKKLNKVVQTVMSLLQTYSEIDLLRDGCGPSPMTTPRMTMSDAIMDMVLTLD